MNLREIPLDVRADAAVSRVHAGEDPYAALAAIVWPTAAFSVGQVVTRYCKRGHAMVEANTYTRPNGDKQCRACIKERNASRVRPPETRKRERKVPCAYCGEPATAPGDKGTGGLDTPRCRACFMEHYRGRRAAAA